MCGPYCSPELKTALTAQLIGQQTQLSLCVRKQTICVPTRLDSNRVVQSQKMARSLKFWIEVEEGFDYIVSV